MNKITQKLIIPLFAIALVITVSVAYADENSIYDTEEITSEANTCSPHDVISGVEKDELTECVEPDSNPEAIEETDIIEQDDSLTDEVNQTQIQEDGVDEVLADQDVTSLSVEQRAGTPVYVTNFAELKSVIINQPTVDSIVLGGDIQFPTNGGITIPANRVSFVIDGKDPFTGINHTINEGRVSGTLVAFAITSTMPSEFTMEIKNANIYGQSYYGTVYVADSIRNVNIAYTNVYYNGPQMIFNRNGRLTLDTVSIESAATGYAAEAQEIGEINSVLYKGVNLIKFERTNGYGMFQFTGNQPTSTAAENSKTKISTNRFYLSKFNGSYIADFEGERNSVFEFESHGTNTYPIFEARDIFLNSAELSVRQSVMQRNYMVLISGELVAMDGSILQVDYTGPAVTGASIYPSIAQTGLNATLIDSKIIYYSTQANPRVAIDLGETRMRGSSINIYASKVQNVGITGGIFSTKTIRMVESKVNIVADDAYKMFLIRNANGLIGMDNSVIDIQVQTAYATDSIIQLNSPLTINDGSELSFVMQGGSKPTTIVQTTGLLDVQSGGIFRIAALTGSIGSFVEVTGTAPKLLIDNPEIFLLFGNAVWDRMFTNTAVINYDIKSQQINTWKISNPNLTIAGTKEDTPTFSFMKKDRSNMNIYGELRANMSFTVNSNYVSGIDKLNPSGNLSFNRADTQVLAIGGMRLTTDEVNERDTQISGLTEPFAEVIVTYRPRGSEVNEIQNGVADADGKFVFITPELSKESYSVSVYGQFLLNTVEFDIIPRIGDLRLEDVPKSMSFGLQSIPSTYSILNRTELDWGITIFDDRSDIAHWELYVVVQDLKPTDTTKPTIVNSFVYVDDSGITNQLTQAIPYKITNSNGSETQRVSWSSNRGVLLGVGPEQVSSETDYNGELQWVLQSAP
ncbi:hypothetical protein G7062_05785 [Erysipelothrix sp. HDW6C]|uniref:pectate lyase-like adhesive domain-containing protein n=1 Tax=Erysipelothrix sp. HDW6C TaxID=2714930 RepID=UPI0014088AAD|nr:pectate lyase-like adhesive domain-containing protein [Erysipelothrix sp. HDW6C]QIK69833.1 hypothetical protein G7062_05785 [Erysipelothrix sp. HDW6C]